MRNNKLKLSGLLLFFILADEVLFGYDVKKLPDGLYAAIETDKGAILLQLEYEKTPLTVTSFVGLAEGTINFKNRDPGKPYYDGLKFHRVIKGFMIQGGDPFGTGTGGPGYQIPNEIDPSLRHSGPGVLAMANAGPDTNGSQFYITHAATPHLDGKYTVFGHVVEGQDVVDAIQQNDRIIHVVIVRKGKKAEKFKADQGSFDRLYKTAMETLEKKKGAARAEDLKIINEKWPEAKETRSGIRYIIEKEGNGKRPASGSEVSVNYTGSLLNGQVFDSSYSRKKPIEFVAGAGRVIPGWDETVLLMAEGEKRVVIIPPELAYGSSGAGGVIPPNAYLVFEMELVEIK